MCEVRVYSRIEETEGNVLLFIHTLKMASQNNAAHIYANCLKALKIAFFGDGNRNIKLHILSGRELTVSTILLQRNAPTICYNFSYFLRLCSEYM